MPKKNVTRLSPNVGKMSVLMMAAIVTIMTLSMHGEVLAVGASGGEPGYRLTVNVSSHPFGTSTESIFIRTANGYSDEANIATTGVASWTFNIPPNQGNSVLVCVSRENCHTYETTGTDMSVSLSPVLGNGNGNYINHHAETGNRTSSDNSRVHHDNDGSGGFNGHHGGGVHL
ncbi:MAG: hypothetical protein WA667_06845 [Candidatus Nitrosopolaris sp.]